MESKPFTGVILAGGNSSRMGTDKSFVTYGKKQLIQHVIDQISPFCHRLVLSANSSSYNSVGLAVIPDLIPEIGPLGGIYSVLKSTEGDRFLICPCDIPDIPSELLTNLTEDAQNADAILLLSTSGKLQPLPIVLTRRCIPYLEKQIRNENYKLQSLCKVLLDEIDLHTIQIQLTKELKNINRPEDLRA